MLFLLPEHLGFGIFESMRYASYRALRKEIVQMNKINKDATVTIVAASASSVHEQALEKNRFHSSSIGRHLSRAS